MEAGFLLAGFKPVLVIEDSDCLVVNKVAVLLDMEKIMMKSNLFFRVKLKAYGFKCLLFLMTVAILLTGSPLTAKALMETQGKGFNSPQQAVSSLAAAVRRVDRTGILAILGSGAQDLVFSGDEVESKAEAADFTRAYDEKHRIKMNSATSATLMIGDDNFIYPIPVIKVGRQWYFDVAAGREELLDRRIGQNELAVIQVMLAYVEAQLEYASQDRDGDGVLEYAQRIKSSPGKKDGLFWPVKEGEKVSPFGPLIAKAASEGYHGDSHQSQSHPYNGYYYRIVTRQGKNAPGGAYDYIVNGNMILGFGLLAWPAKYGVSGIMTFAVNQEGVIYESDLGEETDDIINKLIKYNPDEHVWRKVSDQDIDYD